MTKAWSGPFITARATGERRRILDPLGLDAAGAYMIRGHLLPGITGGLQHARYFSLMTWIVGSFEVSGSRLSWRSYQRRVEHALRLAIKLANPEIRGLVGTDSTPNIAGTRSQAIHSLDKQAPSSFQAQYYGASVDAIGLITRPPGRPPQLTPLGRTLFVAVEEALEEMPDSIRSAGRRLQAGPSEMATAHIERLSEFFQLRTVEAGDPEHEPLVRAVGGLDADGARTGADSRKRARVFGLVIALMGHPATPIGDWRDLLESVTGPSIPPEISASFTEELEAWRCFGERQAQRMAVGGVWSTVFDWIRNEDPFGIAISKLVERALQLLPRARAARASVADPLHDRTWNEFVGAVSEEAGASRRQRFEYRRTLMSELSARSPLPAAERLRVALKLLATCMATWHAEDRAADLLAYGLHQHGGEARMSLAWVANELLARGEQTVASVLRWLIERCVLDQLQRVGYAKGPGTTKLLLAREEDTVLLARDDTEIHPYAQDTNRLGATIALLDGMSLVRRHERGCEVTPAGRRFLAAVKEA